MTPCIICQGGFDGQGRYGITNFEGRTTGAHRAAYCRSRLLPLAAIKGKNVCHECDNPPCVNPEHLFLGTQTQNMQDASSKGRLSSGDRHRAALAARDFNYGPEFCNKMKQVARRGMLHPNTHLTELQVGEIRRRALSGTMKQRDIAKLFGITQTTVSNIKRGVSWSE